MLIVSSAVLTAQAVGSEAAVEEVPVASLVAGSSEWHELTDEDHKAICKICCDVQRLLYEPGGGMVRKASWPQPVLHALQGIVSLLDEISWWGVNGMPCPDGATSPLFDLAVKSSHL